MVSLICVYNDETIYQKQLYSTVMDQDISVEMIGVNNKNNNFNSASTALNYGAELAHGEILVFVHQDITLKCKSALRILIETIEKKPVGSIVGAAGSIEKRRQNVGNYTSGKEYCSYFVNNLNDIVEVAIVDEVLFGMKKETYIMYTFDEEICANWHLYAADMCLHHRSLGNHIYVCPIQIHHYSYGKISVSYMKTLMKLVKKYHKDFKYIWTTCYKIRTDFISSHILYYMWCLNRIVRGNYK